MATRNTGSKKAGKQPASPPIELGEYDDQDSPASLGNGPDTADEILTLQANLSALQRAQVTQAAEAQQKRTTMTNIEKLLAQLAGHDELRGRSQSRSRERQPSLEQPLHSTETIHETPIMNRQ